MSVKIAFASDIHMDHAGPAARSAFFQEIAGSGAQILLLAGDIGTATEEAEAWVSDFEQTIGIQVLWVRGNHDFWDSGIERLRECTVHEGYLTKMSAPVIMGDTVIVGHDGWYDARVGTPLLSVDMNDWQYISEFKAKTKHQIIHISREFAEQAEKHFEQLLPDDMLSVGKVKRVVLVTHVPPFQRVHIDPRGNPGNNHWAPWFVNAKLGEYLLQKAAKHPSIQFDVYCGHTHGACEAVMAPNLRVVVAGADYKHPRLWGLIYGGHGQQGPCKIRECQINRKGSS